MEGRRTTDWLTWGVMEHHRTIGTTLNALVCCDFSIKRIEEFCPTEQQFTDRPKLVWELNRPMFLLVSASL